MGWDGIGWDGLGWDGLGWDIVKRRKDDDTNIDVDDVADDIVGVVDVVGLL